MPSKREQSGELLGKIDYCLARVRDAHRTMDRTSDVTSYLNQEDTIRIEATMVQDLARQLVHLWSWPTKKGGA